MLSDEEQAELYCREYWTVDEFSYVLAGRTADTSQPRQESSNTARKEIEAAISAGSLVVLPGPDSDDRLYGYRRVRPEDAIRWARSKPAVWRFHETFPKFNFVEKAEARVASPQGEGQAANADNATPTSGVGSPNWRTANATRAADALHNQPGGSREKHRRIRDIWASGKYSSRDRCAEEECAALDMSLTAARKALRNTPDPDRTT